MVNNKLIRSKKSVNILGVIFNNKLQWSNQLAQAINKSKKTLYVIKLITKYDWIYLNFQQNFNGRSNLFQISDNSNLRIGKKHFNEQDGRFEQCNPVKLSESEPHLFQTQIEEYFYDLT